MLDASFIMSLAKFYGYTARKVSKYGVLSGPYLDPFHAVLTTIP